MPIPSKPVAQRTQAASSSPATAPTQPSSTELAPDEFYYEGPYLVFTAAYHLKRGYCCNSDCRHCPYRDPTP